MSTDQTLDVQEDAEQVIVETKPDKSQVVGVSYRGTQYHVWHPETSMLWRCHVGKGKLPEALSGMWTGKDKAVEAVKQYLLNQPIPNTSKNRAAAKEKTKTA